MNSEKIKNIGKNIIKIITPYYYLYKNPSSISAGKNLLNFIYSSILITSLAIYSLNVANYNTKSVSEHFKIYKQQIKNNKLKSELIEKLSKEIDHNKDGFYNIKELSDFCSITGYNPEEIRVNIDQHELSNKLSLEQLKEYYNLLIRNNK